MTRATHEHFHDHMDSAQRNLAAGVFQLVNQPNVHGPCPICGDPCNKCNMAVHLNNSHGRAAYLLTRVTFAQGHRSVLDWLNGFTVVSQLVHFTAIQHAEKMEVRAVRSHGNSHWSGKRHPHSP
eukprot:5294946-Amphidinium_carterae.2